MKTKFKTAAAAVLFTFSLGSIAKENSGPIFFKGERVKIDKYTSKKKVKLGEITTEEAAKVAVDPEVSDEKKALVALKTQMDTEKSARVAAEATTPADPNQPPASVPPTPPLLTPDQLINVEILVQDPDAKVDGVSLAGRYIYTGNVPRFAEDNVELYVSKLGLTVRVKAWVDQPLVDTYQYTLLNKWALNYKRFQNPSLAFEPLQNPKEVYSDLKNTGLKKWLRIAMQYMHHSLEDVNVSIFDSSELPNDQYKDTVFKGILRTIMADNHLEIVDGMHLYEQLRPYFAGYAKANPVDQAAFLAKVPTTLKEKSRTLFFKNVGENFTKKERHPMKSGEASLGYLTFVYPIAANKKGPFNQPGEQIATFGTKGTYGTSRWHSDFWGGEYGGLPFMEVVDGVGLHGPISAQTDLGMWYLQRDYVSHGCFRMDAGDVMELWSMLPTDIFTRKKKGMPLQIMVWPDVTDVNESGTPEVMDVGYYSVPEHASQPIANYLLPNSQATVSASEKPKLNAQTRFWLDHFSTSARKGRFQDPVSLTRSTISFDPVTATLSHVPKYDVVDGKLTITGLYDGLKIHTFKSRPTSVMQYVDANAINDDAAYRNTTGLSFSGDYSPEVNNL